MPVKPENAQVLWDVLQEPDLRDFQDLPDVDMEIPPHRGRPAAGAEPSAPGRFEWIVYFAMPPAPNLWAGFRCAFPSARRRPPKSDTASSAPIAAAGSPPKPSPHWSRKALPVRG